MIDIDLNEYDYDLPEERIAQYPLKDRDNSKLLIYDGKTISSGVFRNIDKYIYPGFTACIQQYQGYKGATYCSGRNQEQALRFFVLSLCFHLIMKNHSDQQILLNGNA